MDAQVMKQEQTAAYWSEVINADYGNTVAHYMKMAADMKEAKDNLIDDHGEWSKLIGRDEYDGELPFSARSANYLVSIAEGRLPELVHNCAHLLPASVRKLEQLTQLNDRQFNHAVDSGVLTPKITAKQIKELKEYGVPKKAKPVKPAEPKGLAKDFVQAAQAMSDSPMSFYQAFMRWAVAEGKTQSIEDLASFFNEKIADAEFGLWEKENEYILAEDNNVANKHLGKLKVTISVEVIEE